MDCKIKMQFDPEIAKVLGVEEAIMYANIEFWCELNRVNKKNCFEGEYWTYNSQKAFSELFYFWTPKQIKRILKKLEDDGFVKSSNFNKSKYDRTKWYCAIRPNGQMEKKKEANQTEQVVQPIPDNNTDNKHKCFSYRDDSTESRHQNEINNFVDEVVVGKDKKKNKKRPERTKEEEKQIGEVINIFKQKINPMIKFFRLDVRDACYELIKELGFEQTCKIAEYAISIQNKEYSPTITTPSQLRDKLPQLRKYYEHNDKKKIEQIAEYKENISNFMREEEERIKTLGRD